MERKKRKRGILFGAIAAALLCLCVCLCSCNSKTVTVAVPQEEVDQTRALLLLDELGLIELEDGVGMSATIDDIVSNPHTLELVPTDSTKLVGSLKTMDFAVINANLVLEAGYTADDALGVETASSEHNERYENVVATRADDADSEKTRALLTALQSLSARVYLTEHYAGLVIPCEAQKGSEIQDADADDCVIRVGATASPHAEVLEEVRPLLENHGYKLDIVVYADYVSPNVDLSAGRLDANYMQDLASLLEYNAKNGTNLLAAGPVHCELMGLYSERIKNLDDLR